MLNEDVTSTLATFWTSINLALDTGFGKSSFTAHQTISDDPQDTIPNQDRNVLAQEEAFVHLSYSYTVEEISISTNLSTVCHKLNRNDKLLS